MQIPRYIVIKLEMTDKTTVKATDVTDRCEVYEYEPNDDDEQTEPQTDCDTCKHNGVNHAYDYACDKCTDMDKWECYAEPQTERSEE